MTSVPVYCVLSVREIRRMLRLAEARSRVTYGGKVDRRSTLALRGSFHANPALRSKPGREWQVSIHVPGAY